MNCTTPLRSIRLKCLDCSSWRGAEVEKCPHTACILWPLRFGKKPKGVVYKKISAATYAKILERF